MTVDNTKLFQEIETAFEEVKPWLENDAVMEMFARDFSLRFCWSSNAIEGNTLSLDDTVALIEYDEVRAGKPYTHYQEAKNLYRAITKSIIPFHKEMITEEWIIRNNRIITGVTDGYRTKRVYIGTLIEVAYMPPEPERVPALMQTYLETLNASVDRVAEIIEKVAQDHFTFERIHPFEDGNGRVGRMILNQQLINNGLLPITIASKGEYRRSFGQYDKNGDTSKLIHVLCKEELASISRVRDLIGRMNEKR